MSILVDSYRIFGHVFELMDTKLPCQRPVRWNLIEPCPCDNCLMVRNIGRSARRVTQLALEVNMKNHHKIIDKLAGAIDDHISR